MRPINSDALILKFNDWWYSSFGIDENERSLIIKEAMKAIENATTIDAEPTILSIGVVKEYDNGMVAMRKETYQEYHAIAVNEAVRRLDIEVLSEIERSTST